MTIFECRIELGSEKSLRKTNGQEARSTNLYCLEFGSICGSLLIKECASSPPTSTTSNVTSSPAASTAGFKGAIAIPSPITDKGWGQAGYEAMDVVKSKLGAEAAYVEKVAQADQAEVLSDFARRGLIFIASGVH